METLYSGETFVWYLSQGVILFLFSIVCLAFMLWDFDSSAMENLTKFRFSLVNSDDKQKGSHDSGDGVKKVDPITNKGEEDKKSELARDVLNDKVIESNAPSDTTRSGAKLDDTLFGIYYLVIQLLTLMRVFQVEKGEMNGGTDDGKSKGVSDAVIVGMKGITALVIATTIGVFISYYLGVISKSSSRVFIDSSYLNNSLSKFLFFDFNDGARGDSTMLINRRSGDGCLGYFGKDFFINEKIQQASFFETFECDLTKYYEKYKVVENGPNTLFCIEENSDETAINELNPISQDTIVSVDGPQKLYDKPIDDKGIQHGFQRINSLDNSKKITNSEGNALFTKSSSHVKDSVVFHNKDLGVADCSGIKFVFESPFCFELIEQFFYKALYTLKRGSSIKMNHELDKTQSLVGTSAVMSFASYLAFLVLSVIVFRNTAYFLVKNAVIKTKNWNTIDLTIGFVSLFFCFFLIALYFAGWGKVLEFFIFIGYVLVIGFVLRKKYVFQKTLAAGNAKMKVYSVLIPLLMSVTFYFMFVSSIKSYISYNRIYCFAVYDMIRVEQSNLFYEYFDLHQSEQ